MDLPLLDTWARLDEDARRLEVGKLTAAVAERGLRYVGIEQCSLGRFNNWIAFFEFGGARFSLVPGCALATLGWDRSPVLLDARVRSTWKQGLHSLGDGLSQFEELLDYWMGSGRQAPIQSLLVEVAPRALRGLCNPFDADGEAVRRIVARDGFRLPTLDEWEWCCRGGCPDFFRWGNDWPAEPMGATPDFTLHRLPNAFGLRFLDDPYQVEAILEMDGFVGGDGGTTICGGRPMPEEWACLASAFRCPADMAKDAFSEYLDSAWVRRVLPLSET